MYTWYTASFVTYRHCWRVVVVIFSLSLKREKCRCTLRTVGETTMCIFVLNSMRTKNENGASSTKHCVFMRSYVLCVLFYVHVRFVCSFCRVLEWKKRLYIYPIKTLPLCYMNICKLLNFSTK